MPDFDPNTLSLCTDTSSVGVWDVAWDASTPGTRPGDGVPVGVWRPTDAARKPEADRRREYLGDGGNFRTGIGSPESIEALSQHADDLTRRLGTRAYWAMTRDPRVASCLATLIQEALADELTLTPAVPQPGPGEEPEPDADEAAEILDEDWRSLDRLTPSLDMMLRRMLLSTFVEAQALAEVLMETVEAGPDAGRWALSSLADKTLADWCFLVDRKRHVVGYGGIDEDGDPVQLDPKKVAVLVWQPRAGDPRGTYILGPAYPYVDFKQRLLDPYFQHLDHYASPFTVGTCAPGAVARTRTADDLPSAGNPDVSPAEDMETVLARRRGAGYAAIPNGATIEDLPPAGEGKPFLEAFSFLDRQIAAAILVDDRSTMATEFGSRAASEVGQDNKGLIVREARRLVCDMIYGVLRVLNEANIGPDRAARLTPIVSMGAAAREDRNAALQAWAAVGYQVAEDHLPEIDAINGLTPREAPEDPDEGNVEVESPKKMLRKGDDEKPPNTPKPKDDA